MINTWMYDRAAAMSRIQRSLSGLGVLPTYSYEGGELPGGTADPIYSPAPLPDADSQTQTEPMIFATAEPTPAVLPRQVDTAPTIYVEGRELRPTLVGDEIVYLDSSITRLGTPVTQDGPVLANASGNVAIVETVPSRTASPFTQLQPYWRYAKWGLVAGVALLLLRR